MADDDPRAPLHRAFELRTTADPERTVAELARRGLRIVDSGPGVARLRRRGWFTSAQLELRWEPDETAMRIHGRVVPPVKARARSLSNQIVATLVLGAFVVPACVAFGIGIASAIGALLGLDSIAVPAAVIAGCLGLAAVVAVVGFAGRETTEGLTYQFERDARELMALVGPELMPHALGSGTEEDPFRDG